MADPSHVAPLGRVRATTRRALFGGLLAGGLALGGCGVRLEEDARSIPLLPRREKIPGEDLLIALMWDCAALATTAASAEATLAKDLAELHEVQARTLRDRLQASGVPTALVSSPGPPGPPRSTTASATPPGSGEPLALLAAEKVVADQGAQYGDATGDLASLALSVICQRVGATLLLSTSASPTGSSPSAESSSTVSPPAASSSDSTSSPAASSSVSTTSSTPSLSTATERTPSPADVSTLSPLSVNQLEVASYLLDVITPHTAGSEALLVDETKRWLQPVLQAAIRSLGSKAPPTVLGAPHPGNLSDPAARRAAISGALTSALAAAGTDFSSMAHTAPRVAMTLVPDYVGRLVSWSYRWGAPLTPFPGLVLS